MSALGGHGVIGQERFASYESALDRHSVMMAGSGNCDSNSFAHMGQEGS